MSKPPNTPKLAQDLSKCASSTFTLTFTVEIVGSDIWDECSENHLELGPCTYGIKIQYQLYPGVNFDIDILVWPHVAKIWCGSENCWVRTWLFLERRWLTFSIRHAFPVRVTDLRNFTATVTPTMGLAAVSANAKNDKTTEVFLPRLSFGQRRYFASVVETFDNSLESYILDLIWKPVQAYIPTSFFDGVFDVPQPVTDIRHQDAALHAVRETVLLRAVPEEMEQPLAKEESKPKQDRRESKVTKLDKEKKKPPEPPKAKFEIFLPGDTILSSVGRIVKFETIGDAPLELGDIIVLLSTSNLPAPDDLPIVFCNVDILSDVPIYDLKKAKISEIYTRWTLGNETHTSQLQPLKNKTEIIFNDHHAVILQTANASETVSEFLEDNFQIELHGLRTLSQPKEKPKLFGYDRGDRDFGSSVPPKMSHEDTDIVIAITKIDARALGQKPNTFIRGEYPLYPPNIPLPTLDRERTCTNDVNSIRMVAPITPIIQTRIVLEAQMSLEVSMGVVGCKPPRMEFNYSRLFCLVKDGDAVMKVIRRIMEINDNILSTGQKEELLTGFALDTGDIVFLYLEGPGDKQILHVWEMTEDFYPNMKPVFSSSVKYSSRLYSELLLSTIPFNVLKMFAPLGVLLACPPVYARPALPLPTRSALLKIGRIVASKLSVVPCRSDMPTPSELKSFKLELCVAPRPSNVTTTEANFNKLDGIQDSVSTPSQSVSRINWMKK